MRYALFGSADASRTPIELVRGGRYDEVGAVFGRRRPAAGFSLDLKELVATLPRPQLQTAIRAPWGSAPALRAAIAALRAQGETVVCVLPGHEHEVEEFECDRVLTERDGHWVVHSLAT
jgi:ATP phosphoribosyltransferase regulatory subunit